MTLKMQKITSGTHTVEIIRKLPEIYDALNSRKPNRVERIY